MPRPHTCLDGHDDRHTTHGEGDTCHGEGKVARGLEGKEREVEVTEVPDPDEERQEEEAPAMWHIADAHHPVPDMQEELCDTAPTAIAQEPDEASESKQPDHHQHHRPRGVDEGTQRGLQLRVGGEVTDEEVCRAEDNAEEDQPQHRHVRQAVDDECTEESSEGDVLTALHLDAAPHLARARYPHVHRIGAEHRTDGIDAPWRCFASGERAHKELPAQASAEVAHKSKEEAEKEDGIVDPRAEGLLQLVPVGITIEAIEAQPTEEQWDYNPKDGLKGRMDLHSTHTHSRGGQSSRLGTTQGSVL